MALFKITKKNNCHTFKIRNSRALGGTSRVVLELKPFGISIRGLIGSKPWVGRSIGKMSRNSRLCIPVVTLESLDGCPRLVPHGKSPIAATPAKQS